MNPRRSLTAATLVVVAIAVSACVRTSEGMPVADPAATVSSATSSAPSSTVAAPTTDSAQPEFGVVPTTRAPVPADAVTCSPAATPAVALLAKVADPQAPRVTVALPEGWGVTAGSDDVGAALTGPDGASATVTITATQLDPGAAFRDYTDEITAQAPISTVSILPAELCSYSGQKLMGMLSDQPGDGISYTDHVVHVWTNAGDYLVAVHVQTPTGAPQDAAAIALITDDFEIRLP